jgi:hypothetical protein
MNTLGILICLLVMTVGAVLHMSKNETAREVGRALMQAGATVGLAVVVMGRLR